MQTEVLSQTGSIVEPNIAIIGSLIGDMARTKMLMALMSGKALTATELATEADIMPQTASSHLSKLEQGGIVTVRKQGRHKYFQLKSNEVAELIEQMLNISVSNVGPSLATGPDDVGLRTARVCYDHLAGTIGVQLYISLLQQELILETDNEVSLTESGTLFFHNLGFMHQDFKSSRRPVCKACLDWSERKSHLAGLLGKWILEDALKRKWLNRDPNSRTLMLTDKGRSGFAKQYGVIFD